MARIRGNDGTVTVGGTAVGSVTAFTLNQSVTTMDSSAMGDAWDTHIIGSKSWSGTVDVRWDFDDSGQTAMTAGSSVTLNLYPEGDTSGNAEWTGTVTLTALDYSQSHNETASQSFTFQGNGTFTENTIA